MIRDFNINQVPLDQFGTLVLARELCQFPKQKFRLQLPDKELILNAKRLAFNIFLIRPLVKRQLPITARHIIEKGLITKGVIASIHTEIYNDVIETLHVPGISIIGQVESEILYDIMENIEDLHQWIANDLGDYHLSISAFELCELVEDERVAPLTKINLDEEMKVSISAAESKLKSQGNQLMALLEDETIPNNVIAPYLKLGLLSGKQFPQVMIALGFRDDANNRLVRYPITSSYLEGMQNIREYAIESLAAKKTIYYNKNAMPETQYDNRKQQLLSSTVRYLYPGDCGSRQYVDFYFTPENIKNSFGMNIIDESGQQVCLSRKNMDKFVNKMVKLRTPMTCLHKNGICHGCGGRLTDFMQPDVVVGIESTTEQMSKSSQLVLSAKHFSQTSAIIYQVPELLRDFLIVRQNDIFLKSSLDISKLKIKINFWDAPHINDYMTAIDDAENSYGNIGEQQFSSVNYLTLVDQDDVPITAEVPMDFRDITPYFSSEFMTHIKEQQKNVLVGNEIIIPLKKFDHSEFPLFRYIIESNSMIKFTKTLEKFVDRDIKDFTTLSSALTALADITYQQIDTNLMHLCVILKSYLITSDMDYRIPVVFDPNNVQFGTLENILTRRSLGQEFAYQELLKFVSNMLTYTQPHPSGIFDTFFYATK